MDLTPLKVILAQVALQSDLSSGCSSQVKCFDMARRTPPRGHHLPFQTVGHHD